MKMLGGLLKPRQRYWVRQLIWPLICVQHVLESKTSAHTDSLLLFYDVATTHPGHPV